MFLRIHQSILRRSKVPVVKAKVGPKVMTLMCDAKVFEVLPVKKEAKVVVSGIYITGIKSVRGGLDIPEKKKKKDFSQRKKNKNIKISSVKQFDCNYFFNSFSFVLFSLPRISSILSTPDRPSDTESLY